MLEKKPSLTVNGIKLSECEVVRILRALCAVSFLSRLAVRLAYIGPRLEEKNQALPYGRATAPVTGRMPVLRRGRYGVGAAVWMLRRGR